MPRNSWPKQNKLHGFFGGRAGFLFHFVLFWHFCALLNFVLIFFSSYYFNGVFVWEGVLGMEMGNIWKEPGKA